MSPKARSVVMAMFCAASVTAQFVGGKATRDALFLTSLPTTTLPTVLIATAVCSLLLVAAQARWASRVTPATLVPGAFVVSGLLFLVEWLTRSTAPSATAVFVYLHISGLGPLLASGFWLIASERFDPRTARKGFGRIAAVGTVGGLVGALLSERVAALFGVPAMLVVLAGLQFLTAWLIWRLARPIQVDVVPVLVEPVPVSAVPSRHGLRIVAETAPLRNLAMLVLLGSTGGVLVEYLFKAQAVETLGPGDHLLRFFAVYYGATSLVTFVLQAFASRTMLERFGLALTTSTPSIALLAGSLGSLIVPGFGGLVVTRAGESIFRGSWFRAGYELFFTPMPLAEKRAAKSVIDVGFDRLGDAVGGGLIRLVVVFVPAAQSPAILVIAAATAIGAIIVASTLNRWYLRTLERSLLDRRGRVSAAETRHDSLTALPARGREEDERQTVARAVQADIATKRIEGAVKCVAIDPEMQDILWLRSRDPERVIHVLSNQDGLKASLVPHVIPLLAWEPVANWAIFALRKVAEERIGELVDALIDPNQDFAVRRRLARVFSVAVSQRAADGLMLALDDKRFDVRFQVARSLAAILEKNPRVSINRDRVLEVILREVEVDSPVWESRRLLDGIGGDSPVDAFVRDRASASLAQVFSLLSLILPREPLQIAFRSLHSQDSHLRGTALEYLEGVLPPAVKERLWPFLQRPRKGGSGASRDEIISNLLRASGSITLRNIAEGQAARDVAGFGNA